MKTKTKVSDLLKYIPDKYLEDIGKEVEVNRNVKRLRGIIVFKLILFSLLKSERISFRVMEEIFNSDKFKVLAGLNRRQTRHSSLADRFRTIQFTYFEKIYHHLAKDFKVVFKQNKFEGLDISVFDSTLVGLSVNLFKEGIRTIKKGDKRFIKFTFSIHNHIPEINDTTKKQSDISENIVLERAILNSQYSKNSVIVFDRGLQRRNAFCYFTDNNMLFVTRQNRNVNYKKIEDHKIVKGRKTEELELLEDMIVFLKGGNSRLIKKPFRLIRSKTLKEGKEMFFLTNIMHLNARQITDIYRRRWDIEVFFRFIKQEINLTHFLSRSENGIKVMVYMVLILALLMLVYKTKNNLKGYKIMKIRFCNELEMEIIKDIVTLCGGDFSRFEQGKLTYFT